MKKKEYKKFDVLDLYRSPKTVFTTQEIAQIWKESDLDVIKARINYYVKQNKLRSLRKGIYVKDSDYNRFELATKIYTPSYISLETVLEKEDIVFQHYKTIFVVSYLSRKIEVDGQSIRFRKIKKETLLNDQGIEKKENYFMAEKERAFLDALYLYKDYHFDNLRSLDKEKVKEMVSIYNNKSLEKRINKYLEDV